MKVCLINLPDPNSLDTRLDPPLGAMYLSATLKQNKIDCEVIDLSFFDKDIWKAVLTLHEADIYGLTVYTASFNEMKEVAKLLKQIHPECKVAVGGPHPTFAPMSIVTLPEIDFIIFNEGEQTLLELCQKFNGDYSSITGLGYKTQGPNGLPAFQLNNLRMPIDNIDDLPFPDRNAINLKLYTRKVDGEASTPFMTSRGCAYKCRFCCSSAFWGKPRFHNVNRIKQELTYIASLGYKAVHCWDDTFTLNPHLNEILDHIKSLGLKFRCNGNLRCDTKETLQKLYDSGCREYAVGIESGDQKVLDTIRKDTKVGRNRQVLRWAKEVGLPVKAFIMVGNPGETWDSIDMTIDFVKETGPEYYTIMSFTPLPGSELYHNREKYGITMRTDNWDEYFNVGRQNEGGSTHDTAEMTAEEIRKARKYILRNLPKQTGRLQDYYGKIKK